MSETTQNDAIVIGSGPAGYVCAIRLGQLGMKTVLVEREALGGVCLNVGCIPSKALIHASKGAAAVEEAQSMGIQLELKGVDMGKLQEWKSGIVKKLTGGVGQLVKANGATIVMGDARLVAADTVEVKTADGEAQTLRARNIVLATGSRPVQIPGFEFDETFVLSSTGALALSKLPEELVVIGAGYIGLELGIMYAKLGVQVTVVEMMDQVLPGFGVDVARLLTRKLKKLGVTVHLGAKAKGQTPPKGKAKGQVVVETQKGEVTLAADHVIVAVGRRPNSEGLGLQEIGVTIDQRGFVPSDAHCRTNVASVFSIGDLSGEPMLAHHGSKQGEVAAEVIAGRPAELDSRAVPAVVFTDPEIASVGLSEEQAEAEGRAVKVGKFPYAALGRSLSTNSTDGYFKLVADAETDAVLGAEIVGADASSLIAEAALAVEMGAVSADLALTIHAHPTFPEGLMEAAKAIHGEAIHVVNKT